LTKKINFKEAFMKKFVSGMVLVVLVGFFVSCRSSRSSRSSPEPIPPYEQKTSPLDIVVGSIEVRFEAPNNGWDTWVHDSTKEVAYIKLLGDARRSYGNNIDIKNIIVTMTKAPERNNQGVFHAIGFVVATSSDRSERDTTPDVEGARQPTVPVVNDVQQRTAPDVDSVQQRER
jgi:hypothetical protein